MTPAVQRLITQMVEVLAAEAPKHVGTPAFEEMFNLATELEARAGGELSLIYQKEYETLTVEGVIYSVDALKSFATVPPGTLLRVEYRKPDGTLCLTTLRTGPAAEGAPEAPEEAYRRGVKDGLAAAPQTECCEGICGTEHCE